jgi:flagellar biosynthesis protein FliQ
MSEIFKIRVDGFKEIKKQLLFKSLPILLISMAFGLGIAFLTQKIKKT